MKDRVNKKGFTLIEMIVAIAVLSVLAIFIITTVNPLEQFQKANDARRKSDLSQIQKALETYYQDTGHYPKSSNGTGIANTRYRIQLSTPGNPIVDWGDNWSPYIQTLPEDKGGRAYLYVTDGSASPQSYWLYASLERGNKDPQSCKQLGIAQPGDQETCNNVPANMTCDTGSNDQKCNYGVSSPNVSP